MVTDLISQPAITFLAIFFFTWYIMFIIHKAYLHAISFDFFYYSFTHMCIHCLGHFYPLAPFSPQFQAGPVLPFSLILLKKRHKHNKEDKVFLLGELRIAIQKDS
jgi:hypothetical protein